MIPAIPESLHYEYWANNFASAAISSSYAASVHVEAFDDAVFWEKTFNHFHPDKKFNFIWESNSPLGKLTSGCAQCLKYKDYLSARFFICIDSDYWYLLQEAGITANDHICQTYSYSIENHLCYATKLHAIPETCTGIANTVFDFEAFLLAYSQAVYEAFIWHLYFLKSGNMRTFSTRQFTTFLSLTHMNDFSIQNNAEAIITELTNRCTAKVNQLKAAYSHINIEAEKSYFETLGLRPDNAYLYTRGHNLFDLIVKIGNDVNNLLLTSEAARLTDQQLKKELFARATPFRRELERVIVFEGYAEMDKLRADMHTII